MPPTANQEFTYPDPGDDTAKQGDSSFGYGLNYNPMDPYNMYPHHETGEEKYGPPPMFGINKHDPFNMKPFNPNMFAGMFGAPVAPSPLPPVMNTLGPNPFTPLLQPMTPALPMAPAHPTAPPMMAPMGGMNPLLMAAAMSSLDGDSSFSAGAEPSSSYSTGADPSSSYYMNPYNPYFLDPFAMHVAMPQNPHPTDPNNQYPNPMTGSMTQPGPALAGGYNAYDPQNLIGAPPVFSERERALEHNRAAMQAQSPHAPYRMHQVPVPRS